MTHTNYMPKKANDFDSKCCVMSGFQDIIPFLPR
jgi:hypothetical protein